MSSFARVGGIPSKKGRLPKEGTIYTHELEALLRLIPGWERIRQKNTLAAWEDFNTVNRWVPAWRYYADIPKKEFARNFLDAVERLFVWIDHNF
jgi:hypothetical protein